MRFPYPRLQFWIRFMVLAGLLSLIILFLDVPDADIAWLAGFALAGYIAIALVTLTPAMTAHEVTAGGIVLRQGLNARLIIGLGDIESVEAISMRLWAFGLFPAGETRGRIVLASGSRNLVSIKLKGRMRFGQLLWRSTDEIIIDLMDPGGFVKAVEGKL